MEIPNNYILISPVDTNDIGKCFYCGCISGFTDFAPPTTLQTDNAEPKYAVPCCSECFNALKICRACSIEERRELAKDSISKKYSEALSIYMKWNEDELSSVGDEFTKSIKAGLKLGRETDKRLRYPGFHFEDQTSDASSFENTEEEFWVYEEVFPSFRAALQYASSAYKINPNELLEWLEDFEFDFDKTLNALTRFRKGTNHVED